MTRHSDSAPEPLRPGNRRFRGLQSESRRQAEGISLRLAAGNHIGTRNADETQKARRGQLARLGAGSVGDVDRDRGNGDGGSERGQVL